MQGIEGKVIIITGASSGIGEGDGASARGGWCKGYALRTARGAALRIGR